MACTLERLSLAIGRNNKIYSLFNNHVVAAWKELARFRHTWTDKEPRKRKTPAEERADWVPCFRSKRRTEYKCDPKIVPKWEEENQYLIDSIKCLPPCWDFVPIDVHNYKPSDKCKRKYQRTWAECVQVLDHRVRCKKPKKRIIKRRNLRRSEPEEVPKTACPQDMNKMDFICKMPVIKKDAPYTGPPKGVKGCLKITLPRCKRVRNKLSCRLEPAPTGCKKRCVQYPSYSECKRDETPPAHPVECFCTKTVPMCVVWRYFRKQKHGIDETVKTRICDNW